MAVCALAGVVFLSVHGWQSGSDIVAQPPPPSVDPIQTGSVAGDDAIGGMIQKLDGKAVAPHN